MKKLLIVAAVAATFVSCSDDKKTDEVIKTDTSGIAADAMKAEAAAMASTTAPAAPVMSDGDITMKDGKMMVMKGGVWATMDKEITLANGYKVMLNGDVKMKDHTMKMTEGGMLKVNGDLMDKDGKMLMGDMSSKNDKMQADTSKK